MESLEDGTSVTGFTAKVVVIPIVSNIRSEGRSDKSASHPHLEKNKIVHEQSAGVRGL